MLDQAGSTGQWSGLKVIGAGFGRTGTLSLKVALEGLGFALCYHMVELFEHPEKIEQWHSVVSGGNVDWHSIFEGYQATVDWPGCPFYKELMQAFPMLKSCSTSATPKSGTRVSLTPSIQLPGRTPIIR